MNEAATHLWPRHDEVGASANVAAHAEGLTVVDLLGLVCLSGVSLLAIGYHYGLSDMATWIPMILHRKDPSAFQQDWLIAETEGFHDGFVWAMAQAARLVPLETAFAILHAVERVFFVVGVYLLSMTLAPNRLAAVLSVLIALFSGQWNVGDSPLVASTSIPHTTAVVLSIWALLQVIRQASVSAAVLAALATYMHVLIGLEIAGLIAVYLWVEGRLWQRPVRDAMALYIALTLPLLVTLGISQLGSMAEAALSDGDYVRIVGHVRAPWHYLPSAWLPEQYRDFFLGLLCGALAALRVRGDVSEPMHRVITFMTGAIFVLAVVGTVFVEVFPTSLVLKLQFFRLLTFVKLFAGLYLAQYLAKAIDEGPLWKLPVAAFVVLSVSETLLWGTGFLALVISDLWRHRISGPSDDRQPFAMGCSVWMVALASAAGAILVAHGHEGVQLLKIGWTGQPLAWSLVGISAALLAIKTHKERSRAAVLWGGLVVAGLLIPARGFAHGPLVGSSPLSWDRNIEYQLSESTDWDRLCRWVREQTPAGARFITPPYQDDFRLRAGRATVIDFKSFSFRERDAAEWANRLRDVTNGVPLDQGGQRYEEMRLGYRSLSTRNVRELARKYGATFVITEKPFRLALKVVYENGSYVVAHATQ